MAIAYTITENTEQFRLGQEPELDDGLETVYTQFCDINADYNGNHDNLLITDEQAISQRLFNILSVIPGEEPFEPLWGSGFQRELFELAHDAGPTDRTAMSLETHTLRAVALWMSREITINSGSQFIYLLPGGDGYFINMPFYINKTGAVKQFQRRIKPYASQSA